MFKSCKPSNRKKLKNKKEKLNNSISKSNKIHPEKQMINKKDKQIESLINETENNTIIKLKYRRGEKQRNFTLAAALLRFCNKQSIWLKVRLNFCQICCCWYDRGTVYCNGNNWIHFKVQKDSCICIQVAEKMQNQNGW